MHGLRAVRLQCRVDAKNDCNGFAPIRAFGLGIEQTQVGYKVPLVIRRHALVLGRLGFEWRRRHDPITTSTRYDFAKDTTFSSIMVVALWRF